MYNSDAMIEEHIHLSTRPRQQHQDMEVVVVGIQFWSDSTHVADFGTQSLWPGYMAFGNQCKYTRGDPKTQSIHHIAYLPKVTMHVHLFNDTKKLFNALNGLLSDRRRSLRCLSKGTWAATDTRCAHPVEAGPFPCCVGHAF